jgi:hypothetical protein
MGQAAVDHKRAPIEKIDSSLARNSAALAMSTGRPERRLNRMCARIPFMVSDRLVRGLHAEADALDEDRGRVPSKRRRLAPASATL